MAHKNSVVKFQPFCRRLGHLAFHQSSYNRNRHHKKLENFIKYQLTYLSHGQISSLLEKEGTRGRSRDMCDMICARAASDCSANAPLAVRACTLLAGLFSAFFFMLLRIDLASADRITVQCSTRGVCINICHTPPRCSIQEHDGGVESKN